MKAKLGPNGKIIELPVEDKVENALAMAVTSREVLPGFLLNLIGFQVDKLDFTAIGQPLGARRTANNRYAVTGTVELGRRHAAKDELRAPVKLKFELSFVDHLNEYGLPDLKVESFKTV